MGNICKVYTQNTHKYAQTIKIFGVIELKLNKYTKEVYMQPHRKRVSDKLWQFGNDLDDCNRKIAENSRDIGQLYNPLKAIDYSGMPSSGNISDTTLDTVALIENKHKEINMLSRLKDHIKAEFDEYIKPLNHQQETIIRLRYIEGLKPHQIARKTNYSLKNVERLIDM